jgi:hypothetical protein
MAWIAIVPPSPRHPHERYQVRYQDGRHERSAGICPTLRRAEVERRAIERTGRDPLPVPTEPDPAKAQTLFGEYVTTKWWPAWKDQHPASEYGTRKKVEKRILPTFGDIPLGELDPSTIGRWKAAMVAEGLTARTVNTYLSLLGTILNAAVDDDYLARSPLLRKSGAGRTAATRNQPVPRREVWLLREQLDGLVAAIDPRWPRPGAPARSGAAPGTCGATSSLAASRWRMASMTWRLLEGQRDIALDAASRISRTQSRSSGRWPRVALATDDDPVDPARSRPGSGASDRNRTAAGAARRASARPT